MAHKLKGFVLIQKILSSQDRWSGKNLRSQTNRITMSGSDPIVTVHST
jgi:hypothetical protein